MRWIMPFFVACSTFGAVNGGIFASSRLFFVGARNGHMPNCMALINIKNVTPIPSLIVLVSHLESLIKIFLNFRILLNCFVLQCIITLALLTTSDVFILINFTSFVESLFITMSVGGLLYLRWKQPDWERPIKVSTSDLQKLISIILLYTSRSTLSFRSYFSLSVDF